jgi:exonuclease 3'-5' domain-containing protein 1
MEFMNYSGIHIQIRALLGSLAFSTSGIDGQTLKSILESDAIPKAFFDARNASAALFA